MKVVIAENLKHIEHDKLVLIEKLDKMYLPLENILSCKFQVVNYEKLKLPDNKFDIIFSNGGLENTELSCILNEALRCLKPEGSFIIYFDFTKNLTIDEKKSIKAKSGNIHKWIQANQLTIIEEEIQYNGCTNKIFTKIKFLKGSPLLSFCETGMFVHLKK